MKHILLTVLVLTLAAGCDTLAPQGADDAPAPLPNFADDGAVIADLNRGDRSKRCRCTTQPRGRLTFAVGEGYQFIERRGPRAERANYGLALVRRSGNRLVLGVFELDTLKRVCRLKPDPTLGKLIATYRVRNGRRVMIDELDTVFYWPRRSAGTDAQATTNAVQLPDVSLLYDVRPQQGGDPRPTPQPKPRPWFICPEFEVTDFTS